MSKAPIEITARALQLRGSRLARALLRLAGWQLIFDGLPAEQGVAVIYPHTSNWDFVVAIVAKWAVGLPVTFWSKHTLFRVPLFGRWLRWLGGLPVLRHAPQGAVGAMTEVMQSAQQQGRFMWLALAPEGTRGLTAGWHLGFYHVAMAAGVPVALVVLDYGRKRVGLESYWRLSGDMEADFALFAQRYAGCRGHRPQLAAPVRPVEA